MSLYRLCLWHYHRKHPTADLCEHRVWRFVGGFAERREYPLLTVTNDASTSPAPTSSTGTKGES